MTTIAAPQIHRPFNNAKPLNSASLDYTNSQGIRVSLPVYIDLSITQRKDLLNGVRAVANESSEVATPNTQSGISVASYSSKQGAVEAFIGMSLDVLRTVLFARGGLQLDLVLRLQQVAGIELVNEKDITAACKQRLDTVKSYIKQNVFEA